MLRFLTIAVLSVTLFASCNREEVNPCDSLDKVGDWTEIVQDQQSMTYFFSCYGRWGVMYEKDGSY